MRVAKKEFAVGTQPDLSPFDAGREAYQSGLRLDIALERHGITDKMRDQQKSFGDGYRREHRDALEAKLGREIDDELDAPLLI